MIYGYCRISRKTQNIDRQERNIKDIYQEAVIIKEAFTGTKLDGRDGLNKLLKRIVKGDTIVFDSVSRMSRNAKEGYELYMDLFDKGVDLVFLKEHHIDTQTYKDALANCTSIDIQTGDDDSDSLINDILKAVYKYQKALIKKQIKLAFEQAEKEVMDLRQRTKEGIQTARIDGKQIGQKEGNKLNVKKSEPSKQLIIKYSKDFNGTLNDADVMKLAGISRNTYYKYKREIKQDK